MHKQLGHSNRSNTTQPQRRTGRRCPRQNPASPKSHLTITQSFTPPPHPIQPEDTEQHRTVALRLTHPPHTGKTKMQDPSSSVHFTSSPTGNPLTEGHRSANAIHKKPHLRHYLSTTLSKK
ncbi:hypothetical protein AMELA_G00260850 [Ameiurus melas]|uniref:Uncharacterized protein n=1 Tax=Ameiurus melas TaxID=219545 RepID=A0A7J5ZNL7_AMEME|nr:hypothetical protein AMELA_G00260850 [Ameiurus melas]